MYVHASQIRTCDTTTNTQPRYVFSLDTKYFWHRLQYMTEYDITDPISSFNGSKVLNPSIVTASTRQPSNAGLMLCQLLRRWHNIKLALSGCLELAGTLFTQDWYLTHLQYGTLTRSWSQNGPSWPNVKPTLAQTCFLENDIKSTNWIVH